MDTQLERFNRVRDHARVVGLTAWIAPSDPPVVWFFSGAERIRTVELAEAPDYLAAYGDGYFRARTIIFDALDATGAK